MNPKQDRTHLPIIQVEFFDIEAWQKFNIFEQKKLSIYEINKSDDLNKAPYFSSYRKNQSFILNKGARDLSFTLSSLEEIAEHCNHDQILINTFYYKSFLVNPKVFLEKFSNSFCEEHIQIFLDQITDQVLVDAVKKLFPIHFRNSGHGQLLGLVDPNFLVKENIVLIIESDINSLYMRNFLPKSFYIDFKNKMEDSFLSSFKKEIKNYTFDRFIFFDFLDRFINVYLSKITINSNDVFLWKPEFLSQRLYRICLIIYELICSRFIRESPANDTLIKWIWHNTYDDRMFLEKIQEVFENTPAIDLSEKFSHFQYLGSKAYQKFSDLPMWKITSPKNNMQLFDCLNNLNQTLNIISKDLNSRV